MKRWLFYFGSSTHKSIGGLDSADYSSGKSHDRHQPDCQDSRRTRRSHSLELFLEYFWMRHKYWPKLGQLWFARQMFSFALVRNGNTCRESGLSFLSLDWNYQLQCRPFSMFVSIIVIRSKGFKFNFCFPFRQTGTPIIWNFQIKKLSVPTKLTKLHRKGKHHRPLQASAESLDFNFNHFGRAENSFAF